VKSSSFLAIVLILAGYAYLAGRIVSPPLPSSDCPVVFYSNQQRQDLWRVLRKSFLEARTSIDLTVYAITDPPLIDLLHKRAAAGVDVNIRFDPSATPHHLFSPPIQVNAPKRRGLMHRKIVTIDKTTLFLGSANLTTSSLIAHDNLTVGLYAPPLAAFLKNPDSSRHFTGHLGPHRYALWLLPDTEGHALAHLRKLLKTARTSIFCAMFTLTHKELVLDLIAAHRRGVNVRVALDPMTARGASKVARDQLLAAGIPVLCHRGKELLHHKWVWIDQTHLLLGSTNWTAAAFAKNDDFLLSLEGLSPSQTDYLNTLAETVALEGSD
jgi:phosphatidylserine/phosphatidylglycerophosphate/cardiolipin synthase-like enzyme